jgi:hypothetical protein
MKRMPLAVDLHLGQNRPLLRDIGRKPGELLGSCQAESLPASFCHQWPPEICLVSQQSPEVPGGKTVPPPALSAADQGHAPARGSRYVVRHLHALEVEERRERSCSKLGSMRDRPAAVLPRQFGKHAYHQDAGEGIAHLFPRMQQPCLPYYALPPTFRNVMRCCLSVFCVL